MVNFTNPKPETKIDIIETHGIQIYFVIKEIFHVFRGKRVCSQLIDLIINFQLLQPFQSKTYLKNYNTQKNPENTDV